MLKQGLILLACLTMSTVLEAQVTTTHYDFEATSPGSFADATTVTLLPGAYDISARVAAAATESDFVGAGFASSQLNFSLSPVGGSPIVHRVERSLWGEEFGFFCGGGGADFNDQVGPWSSSVTPVGPSSASQNSDVGVEFTGALSASAGNPCSNNGNVGLDSMYVVTILLLAPTDFALNLGGSVSISGTPGYSGALARLTIIEVEVDCADGLDDDGDGLTDCADPDCSISSDCFEQVCDDGVDDDGDGLVDCADPDCASLYLCVESNFCADGLDNDQDGATDCADSDCATYFHCIESINCDDGLDNDADGLIDCEDPDCAPWADCIEAGNCADGIDNDLDGTIDCEDEECALEVTCEPSFIRGDCNTDGSIDIADPVYNLAYQFSGGPALCLDAHDVNDDGQVNIGDPIFNLTRQFTGGPPPMAPFPDCGPDPTGDPLDCAQFSRCL